MMKYPHTVFAMQPWQVLRKAYLLTFDKGMPSGGQVGGEDEPFTTLLQGPKDRMSTHHWIRHTKCSAMITGGALFEAGILDVETRREAIV